LNGPVNQECTLSLLQEKAVDLYVLERAFLSTHPDTEHLMQEMLESYKVRREVTTRFAKAGVIDLPVLTSPLALASTSLLSFPSNIRMTRIIQNESNF